MSAIDKQRRDEAWDIRTELLTVIGRLRILQERLMDRVRRDTPKGNTWVIHAAKGSDEGRRINNEQD
jgi:hypothetical protein